MLQLARSLSFVVLSVLAGWASADQIDFDTRDQFAYSGQSIVSGGYSFLAVGIGTLGFLQVDAQPDIVGNGSRRLLSGNHTEIELTKVGGGKFDLLGLAYGGSFKDQPFRWADAVEIVGRFDGGSVISRQVSLTGLPAALHYADFTDFTDVQSILFRPMKSGNNPGNNFEFVLDDIRVASVPEPESWLLLGDRSGGVRLALAPDFLTRRVAGRQAPQSYLLRATRGRNPRNKSISPSISTSTRPWMSVSKPGNFSLKVRANLR